MKKKSTVELSRVCRGEKRLPLKTGALLIFGDSAGLHKSGWKLGKKENSSSKENLSHKSITKKKGARYAYTFTEGLLPSYGRGTERKVPPRATRGGLAVHKTKGKTSWLNYRDQGGGFIKVINGENYHKRIRGMIYAETKDCALEGKKC